MKDEVKKPMKVNISTKTQVVAGLASLGAVYLLGIKSGFKIGKSRGRLEGYANATHDLADVMQRIVKSSNNNQN